MLGSDSSFSKKPPPTGPEQRDNVKQIYLSICAPLANLLLVATNSQDYSYQPEGLLSPADYLLAQRLNEWNQTHSEPDQRQQRSANSKAFGP